VNGARRKSGFSGGRVGSRAGGRWNLGRWVGVWDRRKKVCRVDMVDKGNYEVLPKGDRRETEGSTGQGARMRQKYGRCVIHDDIEGR
jgi:hypothetical protein